MIYQEYGMRLGPLMAVLSRSRPVESTSQGSHALFPNTDSPGSHTVLSIYSSERTRLLFDSEFQCIVIKRCGNKYAVIVVRRNAKQNLEWSLCMIP